MITKEEFPKIVNFMTPGEGVVVLKRGHISHIVTLQLFLKHFYTKDLPKLEMSWPPGQEFLC